MKQKTGTELWELTQIYGNNAFKPKFHLWDDNACEPIYDF